MLVLDGEVNYTDHSSPVGILDSLRGPDPDPDPDPDLAVLFALSDIKMYINTRVQ